MIEIERGKGEAITIGENVTIKVVGVWTKGVRLAIEAPRFIKIIRAELLTSDGGEEVKREQV